MPLPSAITDLIQQSIAEALWRRPELKPLREPVESALNTGVFAALLRDAFEAMAARSSAELPQFFDEGFLRMPAVLKHLGDYVVLGQPLDLDQLAGLYAKRHLDPAKAPDVRAHLMTYLGQLRETLAAHPTYGPVLLSRDVQSIAMSIRHIVEETRSQSETQAALRDQMNRIETRLETLLREPEVQALVQRKRGTHVFLSYSRKDIGRALRIRNALAEAGHQVWQDITSIKGGDLWLNAIDNGIRRAYAVVIVLSTTAWDSYWVREEFAHAQRNKKHIVPVNIDGCETPFGLNQLNPIDAHTNFDVSLLHLRDAVPVPPADAGLEDGSEGTSSPVQADPRALEIEYLNRILLEHSVWKELYTPMAGVVRTLKQPERRTTRQRAATITPEYMRDFIQKDFGEKPELSEAPVGDIAEVVEKVKRLVVLGEPGSGKTTTLWLLAARYADSALKDPSAPLPILIRLGALEPETSLRDQIQAQLGDLQLDTLPQQRIALLLDALNELKEENRDQKLQQIRTLIEQARQENTIAVVTCREIDYPPLDLDIIERVRIAALDPVRIRDFCIRYLPDDGDALFWAMAGKSAKRFWDAWQREKRGDFQRLWESDEACGSTSTAEDRNMNELRHAMRTGEKSRQLLVLARNPYMLFMITQVYDEKGELPPNRGKLFDTFTSILLLGREKLPQSAADALRDRLAAFAFAMRRDGLGTSVPKATAEQFLSSDDLYRALSANLLDGSDEIRFSHELLNEYFAAHQLDREMQSDKSATQFWKPADWWKPNSAWDETAILLGGLYSADCTRVITWLRDAQPELAARVIVESGAFTPASVQDALRERWKPRLTGAEVPQARSAVGRALGLLYLDDREHIGLRPDGLPDIAWADEIAAGKYRIGEEQQSDNPPREIEIKAPYRVSKYLITQAQYLAFQNDTSEQGYRFPKWWQELAADDDDKRPAEARFQYANHPMELVNWYQAVAFCRWLTFRYQEAGLLEVRAVIRLPHEYEWEVAARGTDGRFYSYQGDFDAAKGNTRETNIGQTSAVGIFPDGASPCGALDMTGNTWEWCENRYGEPDSDDMGGTDWRGLRGGAWYFLQDSARAAARSDDSPSYRFNDVGFRVVCVVPHQKGR
jgi:formylglycine-generating enzyme required for sulfatase activity/energy-coupling factor transporter ATP-binding protein EcfA2